MRVSRDVILVISDQRLEIRTTVERIGGERAVSPKAFGYVVDKHCSARENPGR